MTKSELKVMLDYHYWAHRQVWICVSDLTEPQYQEDLFYSQGSIHQQCVHTLLVEQFWLDIARDTVPEDTKKAYDRDLYPAWSQIQAVWHQLEQDTYTYLDILAEGEWSKDVEYDFPFCGRQVHPRWKCLFYIVTHGVDHRAQILAGIHRLGGETVMQDFTTFLWNR